MGTGEQYRDEPRHRGRRRDAVQEVPALSEDGLTGRGPAEVDGERPFLRALGEDFGNAFLAWGGTAALLAIALLLQIAYWYFGAPGPGAPREPLSAIRSVLCAVLLFGVIPLLLARPLGLKLPELGLGARTGRSARQATLWGIALVIPLAWFASGNEAIAGTYPWPGGWAGSSVLAFVSWAFVYALYYIAYEFFYRGFLLHGLAPTFGTTGALWLQTIMSTMLHLGKPLAEAVAALPAGILFGLIVLRTRSLVPAILIHLTLGVATDLFSLVRSGALTP